MTRRLPPKVAFDIALDHLIWLRLRDPSLTPQEAAATVGASAASWAEAVLALTAAWEKLPETIRCGGNHQP